MKDRQSQKAKVFGGLVSGESRRFGLFQALL